MATHSLLLLLTHKRYRVIDLLGQGTFGQVVKCERITTGELFSVKVIKNKVAYREQSRMEVEILKQVRNHKYPKSQLILF
jgi:serine/threonine protein kinase